MSQENAEAEKIKKIVAFKKKLERRVEELESELKDTQTMLETVNSILLEKGFKRAGIVKALPPKKEVAEAAVKPLSPTEHEEIVPLKTIVGELLANLYISEKLLRVIPVEDKRFNVNTPPFTQFLVERVLTKMQEKDKELAGAGQLEDDKTFSYSIVREGDIIREVIIRNFNADRLKELKSSIRWTLEKMYEKING